MRTVWRAFVDVSVALAVTWARRASTHFSRGPERSRTSRVKDLRAGCLIAQEAVRIWMSDGGWIPSSTRYGAHLVICSSARRYSSRRMAGWSIDCRRRRPASIDCLESVHAVCSTTHDTVANTNRTPLPLRCIANIVSGSPVRASYFEVVCMAVAVVTASARPHTSPCIDSTLVSRM